MKEIEALKILFDKKARAIRTCKNKWVVEEKAPNATFKCLEIVCRDGIFCEIEKDFYRGIKNTTEDRSRHLHDSDCDGVSAVKIADVKHYIFVDLKSNFDIQKVNEAYLQDLHTLLKLHTMLSLCEGYDLHHCIIDLIVACKRFKDQTKEDCVMDIILQKTALEEDSFEKNFLNDLLNRNQPKICKLEDFKSIKELPFHSSIKQAKVRMHLILSEEYEDISSIYTFE